LIWWLCFAFLDARWTGLDAAGHPFRHGALLLLVRAPHFFILHPSSFDLVASFFVS
jgi:hypothetical protein